MVDQVAARQLLQLVRYINVAYRPSAYMLKKFKASLVVWRVNIKEPREETKPFGNKAIQGCLTNRKELSITYKVHCGNRARREG